MDHLLLDSRLALRRLRQSPGFTAAAILTLALGIGANTTTFSALNKLVLRPLPVEKPDELVFVNSRLQLLLPDLQGFSRSDAHALGPHRLSSGARLPQSERRQRTSVRL